jgi:cytochrome c-type biogenesis protein CcmH/NrfG
MSVVGSEQHSHENYSSAERKLKRITEAPFNPPSTQHIEDKINQMRQKIAKQADIESKPSI